MDRKDVVVQRQVGHQLLQACVFLLQLLTVYKVQIIRSAFLLGYSYFEAFLADLIREIYCVRRTILPQEKALKFSEVLQCSD